ncbi:hypothetical protein FHS29_000803 [Saccharothrix tamanrassetensis]|uniref:Saccharopine dehydrogenase NADP binding domain-containing protein n=1 Tax=Saccharothrix tamanrassetensis TaxID=1051531 RepID=A0A841CBA8_9PSEU|nr:saccharopine dehydrogenase NADP-binding domain-containing protein [Saccharothrix tamanrassetensis]MBB5954233.1 hypothetical protein [Saccharothrix tamanrassetensis]
MEVVVADLGGGVRVDVTDGEALREVLRPADVVLNTVGPFYRFGAGVLRAAIDTGTDYLDICDDWEPIGELMALDGAARAAGVRAVIGMGASPGVSNLLAALAVRELEVRELEVRELEARELEARELEARELEGREGGVREAGGVEEVYTAWPADGTAEAGAALVHWMRQISGRTAVVEGGEVVEVPPLRAVRLELPGGFAGTAYTVGHPEPVMFHGTFRPVASSTLMVASAWTIGFLEVLRRDIDAGRLTVEEAAAEVARPGLGRVLRGFGRRLAGKGSLPSFFAVARGGGGGGGGGRVAVTTLDHPWLMDDVAEATGLPLALGLVQLSGVEPGVYSPEAVIDAERFFRDLALHHPGVVVRTRVSSIGA